MIIIMFLIDIIDGTSDYLEYETPEEFNRGEMEYIWNEYENVF